MVKGWNVQNGNTYYFDLITGTMVKGTVDIDGNSYFFDTTTGILQSGNTTTPNNGWYEENGNKYWYENGVRQGLEGRGKEIYDPDTDAWYWLDSVDNGKMAVSKDVYQESYAGVYADRADGTEKWVRYDENGHMVKGWNVQNDNTYYFDLITGAMVKGNVQIDGKDYTFDTTTGVLQNSGTSNDTNNPDDNASGANEDVTHVHSYTENVTKEATCGSDGTKTFTCSGCNDSYTESIPATGMHIWDSGRVTQEATCTSEGVKTYTCTVCGKTKIEAISKTAHRYTETVVNPTCTEKGYTEHTCSVCSDTYKDNYVDIEPDAHVEGEWEITIEPTYTEAGEKVKKCTKCGTTLETEEIPVLELTNGDAVYTITLAGGSTTTVIGHYDTEKAADLAALVNAYRVENGLTELTVHSKLQEKADIRGYQTSYYWEHLTPAGQSPTALYNYSAENLAWCEAVTSAQDIFDALKDCEDHDAIMLSTYTGNITATTVFCKKVGEDDYEYYWVQVFR